MLGRAGHVLGIVTGIQQALAAAQGADDCGRILIVGSKAMGFDYVALAEHGNLADFERPLVLITNYPQSWQRHFINQRFDRIDPVQEACRTRMTGFRWSDLRASIALSSQQRAMLDESRQHGLADGFTVPLHLPGARAASCSFAVRIGRRLPQHALWAADLTARATYERMTLSRRSRTPIIGLSPRQRACVALLAAGLTDRGIARRLSLSEETVTKYLNAARRRYGLARRSQLVAAALRDGVIGYEDLALD